MKKRLYLSLAIIFFLSLVICLPAFSQQPVFPYCTDASYYCQKKVAQVPIPWQFWGIDEFGNIIDRIRISPTWLTVPPVGEGTVFVRRQFAITPTPLPLEGLVWNFDSDSPPGVEPMPGDQRTWRMVDNVPEEVIIGQDLELTIPTADIIASQDFDQIGVLVSYEVLRDNEVVAHFINQAIVEANVSPPKIVKILVNFDIHNKTDYNPTNFELDFLGMNFDLNDVEHAMGFVVGTGEQWGANPTSPLIVRPIPGGTEVKWIQHDRPLQYCEWLHIGLVIDCVNFDCFNNPDDPILRATVQGYWTIIQECQKKVAQVPLPWQFWGVDENGNIIDRIRISPTWLNPILPDDEPAGEGNILVRRQYAVLPGPGQFIPLEDLVWDSGAANPSIDVNWRQKDTASTLVTEGQDLELIIPSSETDNAGAVLVAYEVMLDSGEVVGHFINEAILEAQVFPPKIIRVLVNFDIHNNTNYDVTNFELDFHNLDFKCEDVLWAIGYVKGTGEPWGANSVNPLVVRPIPGGTEVKWVQPERPLKYCEWLHVGLMFDCTDFECFNNPADSSQRATVQGYWTIIESPPCIFKAPITSTGQPNTTATNVSRVFIGFDTEALTYPSPGPPPEYTVYSALDGSLLEDYREAGASDHEEWRMTLQIGPQADPEKEGFYPVISWNPANLCPPPDPDSNMSQLSLWYEDNDGNRKLLIWDMHQTTQYQTKESEFLYVSSQRIWFANYLFVWSSEISVEMHFPQGWSMVSLPVKPRSALVSDLFPGAVVVYGYDKASGYVRVNKMEPGKGYWILFYEDKAYTITGRPFFEYNSTVNTPGWEMIGGCTFDAKATTDSCDIIVIYEYLPGIGYRRLYNTEFLMPGTGYWILLNNVINQCVLTVQGAL
ncbi:MAG: hypothetical protein ACMUHX_05555 [bacterium]